MNQVKYIKWILFLILGLSSLQLLLADEFDEVKVLEDQRFSRTGKFSIGAGFSSLPLDAYYKPMAFELSGGYQFSDLFSWEFLRAGYSLYNYDTGFQNDLRNETGHTFVQAPIFKKTRYYLASEAALNLFYGKLNFLNEKIIYQQISLEGGPMFIDFSRKKQLGIDLGIKFQFLLSEQTSVHLKASHMIGLISGAPANVMILNLGVGFAF